VWIRTLGLRHAALSFNPVASRFTPEKGRRYGVLSANPIEIEKSKPAALKPKAAAPNIGPGVNLPATRP